MNKGCRGLIREVSEEVFGDRRGESPLTQVAVSRSGCIGLIREVSEEVFGDRRGESPLTQVAVSRSGCIGLIRETQVALIMVGKNE